MFNVKFRKEYSNCYLHVYKFLHACVFFSQYFILLMFNLHFFMMKSHQSHFLSYYKVSAVFARELMLFFCV